MKTVLFIIILALLFTACLLISLLIIYKMRRAKDKTDEIEQFLIWLNEGYQIVVKDPSSPLPSRVYLFEIHKKYYDRKREIARKKV